MLTVFILNQPVKQDTSHGYSAAGEEWVVIHSIADFNAGRRVYITGEKGEDVILWQTSDYGLETLHDGAYATAVAGLDNQAQIWWQGTSVGSPGSLLVGVRCR